MIFRSNCLAALVCGAVAGLLGTSTVSAQVYGTDYLAFRGEGVVLDNPTSAGCQSQNINFGTTFFFIYRFTANPSSVAEAIDLTSGNGSTFRMLSTQSPGFSFNGTSTYSWTLFNRHGDFFSGTGTSTITIASGLGQPVNTGTGNLKFTQGNISAFFGSGCSITNFHAAAVAVPN
jgi:hypothetical protein